MNAVIRKIEMCKCLWKHRVMMSDINEKIAVNLLYFVVMREQDAGRLHLQSSYSKG